MLNIWDILSLFMHHQGIRIHVKFILLHEIKAEHFFSIAYLCYGTF